MDVDDNFVVSIIRMEYALYGQYTCFSFPKIQAPFTCNSDISFDLALSREKDQEIENLKKLLDLKTTLSRFSIVYATSIYRNVDYFNESITLDKGSDDGIAKDMAVVTELGLVGKIDRVMAHSSELKLLTAQDGMQLSVVVNSSETSFYGVLSEYQRTTDSFLVTGIPATANVQVGDTVTTSGLGGIFPAGIYIGTVSACQNDAFGITKNIQIKANQDFNHLKYVAILKKEETPL